MKKHDEGYVMILVLVVMIVMGLVTASILTFSLRNLQNQQLSIERMADKYAAQGELQKMVEDVVEGRNFSIGTDPTYSNDNKTLFITLTSEHETASITCVLRFDSEQTIGETKDDEGNTVYVFSNMRWKYASYTITYSTPEEVTGK